MIEKSHIYSYFSPELGEKGYILSLNTGWTVQICFMAAMNYFDSVSLANASSVAVHS
jgi:hypothetical protein